MGVLIPMNYISFSAMRIFVEVSQVPNTSVVPDFHLHLDFGLLAWQKSIQKQTTANNNKGRSTSTNDRDIKLL